MKTALPPEDRAMLNELHAKHCSPVTAELRSHHELAPGAWMPFCRAENEDAPYPPQPANEEPRVRPFGQKRDAWFESGRKNPLPRELDGRRIPRRDLDGITA